MTIKEIQELVKFADEKSGNHVSANEKTAANDISRRFFEVIRDANASGTDLTEMFVEWAGKKKE